MVCHIIVIYVFVSSCKCYSRLVNVCHGFVPSCFCYFCHTNVFHAHACHAIVGHAIVTSCKCFSCKRDHVNELHTSASSRVPRWLLSIHLATLDPSFTYCLVPSLQRSHQGLELISSFRKLLNPYQVFDLSNGGPLPGNYCDTKTNTDNEWKYTNGNKISRCLSL